MKRIFLCGAAALLLLTACNEKVDYSSAVTITKDGVEGNVEDIYPRIKSLLEQYYAGMRDGNFDLAMSTYPDFYIDLEKKWIDENIKTSYDEAMKANSDWYADNYGENYKVQVNINEILQLTEDSLTKMQEILKKNYNLTEALDDCYHFTATEITTGSGTGEPADLEWYVLCYDGKTYLYDTLYETN